MRAVVLVGGIGTRLRPLTNTTPKQMLPIVELPMIERVLGWLAPSGVDAAVLSMGYRPDAFLAAFPSDRCAGVDLTYAVEPSPLDTAGGIRFAARAAGITETFFAVNGDVLTDFDLTTLLELHRGAGARATIHLTPVEDPSAFGVVLTDDAGRVLQFVEKPSREDAPSNLVNAGSYVLEPDVLEALGEGPVSIEREVFPRLAAEGSLYALPSPDYWIDTGTPATYLRAQLDLLDGHRAGPPAPGAKRRDPGCPWTIGAAVVDGEVRAPALVGDAAFVAAGAVVERSVVGAGARVHERARVTGSVLLGGAVVRAGAVVDGSVLGQGAVVGGGAEVTGGTVVGDGVHVEPGTRLDNARVGG